MGSAIVAKVSKYLRSVVFAHICLEYILTNFCFFPGITHFLKLRSTLYGEQPSFRRLTRFSSIQVFSVTLQKNSEGIVLGIRHLFLDSFAIGKQRERQSDSILFGIGLDVPNLPAFVEEFEFRQAEPDCLVNQKNENNTDFLFHKRSTNH
jgi:hypothetical protein